MIFLKQLLLTISPDTMVDINLNGQRTAYGKLSGIPWLKLEPVADYKVDNVSVDDENIVIDVVNLQHIERRSNW